MAEAQQAHDAAMAAIEKMWGGEPPAEPPAQEQVEAPPVEEQAGTEAQEQGETPAQSEETQEVEIDGEVYLIPKKIAERFIHHADYTRKSQDVAEMRRALSAEKEVVALDRAFAQSISEEQKRLTLLDAQIAQYKQLDWGSIDDTGQLMKLRTQYDQLKDARAELDNSLKAKRGEFEKTVKEKTQEAIQAGQKYVEQHVKGFDDGAKRDLFAYGLNEGYTRDELDRIVDPRIIVTLWKARQWDSLQASKPEVTKRAAQAAPVMKPGATQSAPSKLAVLTQGIKNAQGKQAKTRAAEDYFTERFTK